MHAPPLYIEEVGEGAPILMIHGFGASLYTWRHIKAGLADQYRVITLDLQGFGLAQKPSDGAYTVEAQARLVQNLIRAKKLEHLTIIGHSYGGGVALATRLLVADDVVRRIARLVIIDGMAYPQAFPWFIRLLRVPLLAEAVLSICPPRLLARRMLAHAYGRAERVPNESITEYAKILQDKRGRNALVKTAKNIVPKNLNALTAGYRSINQPTLVMWGQYDAVLPMQMGKRLCAELPNSTWAVIWDSGHIPQEEQPEATLAVIKQFLAATA